MPKNPESVRYKSPSERGYKQVWVSGCHKKALDAAARRAGFTSTDDYIWSLYKNRKRSG